MEEIKITDFLEKESAIKTQLQDSIDWIPNVVVDLHEDSQEIDLIYDDRYSSSLILVGDAIKLNYVDDRIQYMVDTWITGIRIDPVKVLTVKVVSIKKMANLILTLLSLTKIRKILLSVLLTTLTKTLILLAQFQITLTLLQL